MIDKPGSFMDNGLQIFLRIVGVRNNPVSKTKRKDEEKE